MTTSADASPSTDRIDKQFHVNAPRSRVWRAIANAEEFGTWFRLKLAGPFTPGASVHGHVTIPDYEHLKVEMVIEKIEPERYFSYRWHPYPADPTFDYSAEAMTLVEFTLEETATGTTVSISESGFDKLPASRRAEAFRMNEAGWTGQAKHLTEHVEQS